ncbi:MAG TPA: universal stress protein [Stellaceae bacterium]|nr:universal stress protein [Stellaceae bacterium]
MSFKDILVYVDSTGASRLRLQVALTLAGRFDARLSGLHVIPKPDVPPYFKPSVVERVAKIYSQNAKVAAAQAETLFREETRAGGITSTWECTAGDMEELIAERARFADLLVLGQFDTENPPTISSFLLPAKVVFGSAAPILVIPNTGKFGDAGRHPLIAWDGSREAARAISDALPLLKGAEKVSLLSIDPLRQGHMHDGTHLSEIVAHLARHGVVATAKEIALVAPRVTNDLLEHASRIGADLLVMGAYGHSRVWEFVVGGTTQDLLEKTTIPVLMSR